MFWHQAVAEDVAVVLPQPFGEQRQIDLIALLGVEDSLAVVARWVTWRGAPTPTTRANCGT